MCVPGLKFSWALPYSVNTKTFSLLTMCVLGLNFSYALPYSVNTKNYASVTMCCFPPSLIVSGEIRGAKSDRLFWSRLWVCSPRVLPADTKGRGVIFGIFGSKTSCPGRNNPKFVGKTPELWISGRGVSAC